MLELPPQIRFAIALFAYVECARPAMRCSSSLAFISGAGNGARICAIILAGAIPPTRIANCSRFDMEDA
jgi:hypothetical protein